MSGSRNKDVDVLLGNPRKAMVAMAVPVMVAMVVQSMNNMIDAMWVAGLGTASLAAVGVAFPYFFTLMGLGNGIGVGSSQAIARRLGAGDRDGADRVAAQAFVITLLVGVVFTVIFIFITEPAMVLSGAGDYLEECVQYGMPLLIGAPFILLSSLFSSLLRSEGAAKRSMMIQMVAAGSNIILDPIFIYGLDMGIGGAAVATVVAMAISLLLGMYWYFVRRDTYIRLGFRGFRFDRSLDWDILRVGIPASMEMVTVAVVSLMMNHIVFAVDPVDGIAIYTTGWRIIDMLMIPIMAVGFAIVPVCAAAYGARRNDKVKEAYAQGLKMGILSMTAIAIVVALIAPYLVMLFTYTGETSGLADQMTIFVRIGCVFLPFIALGYVSNGFFQSLGMGMRSLSTTLFLNFVRLPICYLLIPMASLTALWWGMASAEIMGSVLIGVVGAFTLRALLGTKRTVGPMGPPKV